MNRGAILTYAALPLLVVAVAAGYLAWLTLPPNLALGATEAFPVPGLDAVDLATDGDVLLVLERRDPCSPDGEPACTSKWTTVDPAAGGRTPLPAEALPPGTPPADIRALTDDGTTVRTEPPRIVHLANGTTSPAPWNGTFRPHVRQGALVVGVADGRLSVANLVTGAPPRTVPWAPDANATFAPSAALQGAVVVRVFPDGDVPRLLVVNVTSGDARAVPLPGGWNASDIAVAAVPGHLLVAGRATGGVASLRVLALDDLEETASFALPTAASGNLTLSADGTRWVVTLPAGGGVVFGALGTTVTHHVADVAGPAVALGDRVAYVHGGHLVVAKPGALPTTPMAYGGVASAGILMAGALVLAGRRHADDGDDLDGPVAPRCPECGGHFVDGLDFCPSCGRERRPSP